MCGDPPDGAGGHQGLGWSAVQRQFPGAVPGSIIQAGPASFASGSAFTTQAHINIHNITGYTVLPAGVAATFYTKVGSSFTGPDGKSFQLRYLPDDFACPVGGTCVPNLEPSANAANLNQPAETAWAKVTYTPRDPSQPWSTSNADHWVVDGELTTISDPVYERATLFQLSLQLLLRRELLAPGPYILILPDKHSRAEVERCELFVA
jgi:hypothetical protein